MANAATAEQERLITQARDCGDRDALARLALDALASDCTDEEHLAWVSSVVYEEDLVEALDVIAGFLDHFPESRKGVRVYLADLYAQQGQLDKATLEARAYLAHVHGSGGLEEACQDPLMANWVLQAMQLLSSAYTAAGARTYSQRVFTHAISLSDDAAWTLTFEQGIQDIERELHAFDCREVDYYWRSFMERGDNFEKVLQACSEANLPIMAERVRAIHTRFTVQPGSKLPSNEMVMPTHELMPRV
ncbi:MAG: hypothetical protein KDC87_06660 [Planctomycetes bacterium]|nr:hypothetical protein [Planctomycetota bacterium]